MVAGKPRFIKYYSLRNSELSDSTHRIPPNNHKCATSLASFLIFEFTKLISTNQLFTTAYPTRFLSSCRPQSVVAVKNDTPW